MKSIHEQVKESLRYTLSAFRNAMKTLARTAGKYRVTESRAERRLFRKAIAVIFLAVLALVLLGVTAVRLRKRTGAPEQFTHRPKIWHAKKFNPADLIKIDSIRGIVDHASHGRITSRPTYPPPGSIKPRINVDAVLQSGLLVSSAVESNVSENLRALDINPRNARAWRQLSRTYLDMGAFSQAETALKCALSLTPFDPILINNLGVTLLALDRPDEARDMFAVTAQIAPTFRSATFNKAFAHLMLKEFQLARIAIDTYLRTHPDDVEALVLHASLAANAGQYSEALTALEHALEQSPANLALHLESAAVYALMWRTDDCRAALQKTAEFVPPGTIYSFFAQPAFDGIRLTQAGQLLEKDLADRNKSARDSAGEFPKITISPRLFTQRVLSETEDVKGAPRHGGAQL